MRALIKKELNAFLISPVGYVFLSVYFLIAGWFFYLTNLKFQTSDLTGVFSSLYDIYIYIIPILTMRLFSDEKKHKTDVLLFTSPLRPIQIVFAKLFSSFAFYLLALSVTLLFAVTLSVMGYVNWPLVLCQFSGATLLGLTFITISGFFASFTENQIVAAISSIAALFIFHLSDSFITLTTNTNLQRIFAAISPLQNYTSFVKGVVGFNNLIFFLSVSGLFFYLSVFSITQQTNK